MSKQFSSLELKFKLENDERHGWKARGRPNRKLWIPHCASQDKNWCHYSGLKCWKWCSHSQISLVKAMALSRALRLPPASAPSVNRLEKRRVSWAWAHLGVMHFTSPHGNHMPRFMPEFLGKQLIVSSCTLDSVLIWAIHCIITLMSSTSMGQNSISSSYLTSRKAGKSMSTRGRPMNFGECRALPDAHVKAPKSYPL